MAEVSRIVENASEHVSPPISAILGSPAPRGDESIT
jgi:hypothetical protein